MPKDKCFLLLPTHYTSHILSAPRSHYISVNPMPSTEVALFDFPNPFCVLVFVVNYYLFSCPGGAKHYFFVQSLKHTLK